MVTPPFSDSLSSLRLADTFYTWFRRTNDLVTKLNPLQVYGITSGTGGIEVTIDGEGIATISSSLPYIIASDHDFQGGITFSGTPINFHNPGSEHQHINFIGPSTITFGAGTGVFFKNQVTFESSSTVDFQAIVDFHNTVTFHAEAIFKDDVTIGDEQSLPPDTLSVWSTTTFNNPIRILSGATFEGNVDHDSNTVKYESSLLHLDGPSILDCYAGATFHNEVDMSGSLRLTGAIYDSVGQLGNPDEVLRTSGSPDGIVTWKPAGGGGGVGGDAEASRIHMFSRPFRVKREGGVEAIVGDYDNIYSGNTINYTHTPTVNLQSQCGAQPTATHALVTITLQITSDNNVNTVIKSHAGTDNTAQSTILLDDQQTTLHQGNHEKTTHRRTSSHILPVDSSGNITFSSTAGWSSGHGNYAPAFSLLVTGYIMPASAASDTGMFIIKHNYFPDDIIDCEDASGHGCMGTKIAQMDAGTTWNNGLAWQHTHTQLDIPLELRGSNAMVAVQGTISADSADREHVWYFWINDIEEDEDFSTVGNDYLHTVLGHNLPGGDHGSEEEQHQLSLNMPVIDIPNDSTPLYLHGSCHWTMAETSTNTTLPVKAHAKTATWYGGGIGGQSTSNVFNDIVYLDTFKHLFFGGSAVSTSAFWGKYTRRCR